MKKSIVLIAALLAACSKQNTSQRYEPVPAMRSSDVALPADQAAPGVDVTAAPGVAFDYRYAFRLPNNRIAQIQETHAQACEKLGIDKCRITGMRYRLVDRDDVQAMLALRLDPKLARQFGKDATDAVQKSEGMLVDEEISGEDVGSKIDAANRSQASLKSELERIETELAGLSTDRATAPRGSVEHDSVTSRRDDLHQREREIRQQLQVLSDTKVDHEEALAGTPMVFTYGSGDVVPGFDARSPIKDALRQSFDNLIGGFAAILVILITLLPWVFVVVLLAWAFRTARRRWGWFPSATAYRPETTVDSARTEAPEAGN